MKMFERLIFSSVLLCAALCRSDQISGRIFETTHCRGVGNVVVRFTPPKESGKSVVVTSADDSGTFSADLPINQEYYLAIYFGTQQLYGRVVTTTAEPLLIMLQPSDGKAGQNCNRPD